MRKLLAILLLLISIFQLHSAVQVSEALDDHLSESLTVRLNLRDLDLVDIGFSRNEINELSDTVISLGGTEEILVIDEGSSFALPEESIYIYWKILSGSNITASISIPAALRGEGGELEWSVGYSDGTERIDSTASDTSLAVVRHETRGRAKNIGSTELFINTENLNSGDVIPGIYTGELRLDISIE